MDGQGDGCDATLLRPWTGWNPGDGRLNTGEIQLNVFGGPVQVVYVWDALPGWRYQITYAFDTATFELLSRHMDYPR